MSSILIRHHMDHFNLLPLFICKSHSVSEKTCPCHLLHCLLSCSFPAHIYHGIRNFNSHLLPWESALSIRIHVSVQFIFPVVSTDFSHSLGQDLSPPISSRLVLTFVKQLHSLITCCIPSWESPSFFIF